MVPWFGFIAQGPPHTTLQQSLMKSAETLGVKKKKLIPKAMATCQVFEEAKLERLSGNSGNSLHEPRGEIKYSVPFPQPPLLHVFLLDRKDKGKSGPQKEGPAHRYLWDPVALSTNSDQSLLQTPLELRQPARTRGNLRGTSPCTEEVSPSLRPGHEARAPVMVPC